MTDQKNGAGDNAQNAGAKQKKPTSAYRRLRRKFVQSSLREPLVWWRHRDLTPADVFFLAYPKSGTTYIRFVLFEMLSGMPAGFRTTNNLMAGVGQHKNALKLLPGGGRLLASHEHYRKDYRRMIYVVRDGRDVLLSEYAFLKALDFYKDDLDSFIRYFLFTKVSAYGPWHKHVAGYLDSPTAGTDNFMLVRFEDLRKDPVPWFARMADFLGVNVPLERIRTAVANNSIEAMREKENREPVKASIRGRFVRDGKVRGWLSKLTPAQVRLIEEHAGDALVRLVYPLFSELNLSETNTEPTQHSEKDAVLRV
jgi:hypothetical protein